MVLRNVSEQYEKIEQSIRQPKTNALKKKKTINHNQEFIEHQRCAQ